MIYGGDGLARLPAPTSPENPHARGKAVFLPFVLAGEKIEATLTEQKSGFARARVDAIVEPSPHRIAPACPYFGLCGGCHYQHADSDHQLEIKKEILRETLRRTAKLELDRDIEVHPSPPWNYRNRSRFQTQTRPEFAAGYFKSSSRQLLPVEQCPISSPLINRALAATWQNGRAGNMPEGVKEIEFFANADDTQLLVELNCASDCRRAALREWAEDFRSALPAIIGIVVFREAAAHPRTAPEKFLTAGEDHLIYQTRLAAYRVSAGSFFQTNRHLIDELVQIVTAGRSGSLALDLYAGVGLFSTALRDVHHVISVESSQTSSADLSYNRPANGEAVQATTEQFLPRAENSRKIGRDRGKGAVLPHTFDKPDLVVVDPPRGGLGEPVARQLADLSAPRVTYVSCDPATLARDLVPLLAAGYRLAEVHLVDLFPQTYHLESVVTLIR